MTTTYLTPGDLAQRWRMDVKTLSNWRVQGKGPAYVKLGDGRNTKVLYPTQAVEAYEQAGMRLPVNVEGAVCVRLPANLEGAV